MEFVSVEDGAIAKGSYGVHHCEEEIESQRGVAEKSSRVHQCQGQSYNQGELGSFPLCFYIFLI